MIRKPETVHFWRGDLPHWQVEGGRYFVTVHLYGAIPWIGRKKIHEIAQQLKTADSKDEDATLRISRLVFKEMEAWLERTLGVDHLKVKPIAEMVVEAITHRLDRQVWHVFEFVVMPTHLHLFFELGANQSLKRVLEDFKRWTGHRAAEFVHVSRGRFWQKEWFDHWSRSDEEDEKIVGYIRENPVKAGLVHDYQHWPFASWAAPRCKPA